jgi:hypothetical protein
MRQLRLPRRDRAGGGSVIQKNGRLFALDDRGRPVGANSRAQGAVSLLRQEALARAKGFFDCCFCLITDAALRDQFTGDQKGLRGGQSLDRFEWNAREANQENGRDLIVGGHGWSKTPRAMTDKLIPEKIPNAQLLSKGNRIVKVVPTSGVLSTLMEPL